MRSPQVQLHWAILKDRSSSNCRVQTHRYTARVDTLWNSWYMQRYYICCNSFRNFRNRKYLLAAIVNRKRWKPNVSLNFTALSAVPRLPIWFTTMRQHYLCPIWTIWVSGATVLISGALTQPILTQITTALARPVEPDTWRNLKNATTINFEQEIIEQKNIYNIYTFL